MCYQVLSANKMAQVSDVTTQVHIIAAETAISIDYKQSLERNRMQPEFHYFLNKQPIHLSLHLVKYCQANLRTKLNKKSC